MENLYYNLSEEEFSKGRKLLLWGFAALFFLAGCICVDYQALFSDIKAFLPFFHWLPLELVLLLRLIAAFAYNKKKRSVFSD